MATFNELIRSLPPGDGKRGSEFERVAKWFLENDPVQAAQYQRVWHWTDWPGTWGTDAGIDLVGERKDGKLVAIQVKCYQPDRFVSKRDMDTFLSESSREVFAERLLIATCDLGRTARRTVEGQQKPVHTILIDYLEHSPVTWPTDTKKLRSFVPNPRKPRPHQRRAIRDALKGFETWKRGQLIMACGTGKTLTSLWIAEALKAQRTLVLLPSLSLLAQTVREWKLSDKRSFEFIVVCSDQTVVDEDAMVSHTADLPFTGVSTDPIEIANFLRKRGPRVMFATYQSSPKVAQAQALGRVPPFDLAIADEAHRCAGKADAAFASILDANVIKAALRLFMTATPRIASGRLKRAGRDFDLEITSMDDGTMFGPVFHRLSFGEAIAQDLLSDYQVVVMVVDGETVRDYAERGAFVELGDGQIRDARTLAAQIGLAKAMRKFGLRRTLTFHSRVKLAAAFAATLPSVLDWMPKGQRPDGRLWAEHVSGEMPSGTRDRLLRRLATTTIRERAVLSNARCLTEGVDVPTLDGVAFIDPRQSQVDVVQAVGRSIRKAEDKSVGTIVMPVFVLPGEDAEHALDLSVFKPIVQVLRALRDHDEELADQLDALRRELGRRGSIGRLPDRVRIDAPKAVGQEFVRALEARVVELTTSGWEEGFGHLQAFVDREGHARVPQTYVEDGFQLGPWVNRQRSIRSKNESSPDRVERLEALPGWVWDSNQAAWEKGLTHLLRFVDREGHARVPQTYVEDGYRLGQWVGQQRGFYLDNGLAAERAERLAALPGWNWNARDAAWEEAFALLLRFTVREGHARVSQAASEDGFPLGRWVSRQRRVYLDGHLGDERVGRFEVLPGWAWNAVDALWEDGFVHLLRFVAREGHARVPQGFAEGEFQLGQWVRVQRTFRRGKRLSADRVDRLEALPGWAWDPGVGVWEERFAYLQRFVDREGHASVLHTHVEDGFQLGSWVNRQRSLRRKHELSREKLDRLEALPGWVWDANQAAWEKGFAHLLRFVDREGDAMVAASHVEDGFRLGSWVGEQRSVRRKHELSREKLDRLEALPGWVWDANQAAWEKGFAHLLRFVDHEGDAMVLRSCVEDGYKLGEWVHVQRMSFRRRDLQTERVARLEALPGWTW